MDVGPDNHNRLFGRWDVFSWLQIYNTLKDRKGHDLPEFYRGQDKIMMSGAPQ